MEKNLQLLAGNRDNNLNLIKLLAAMMVIVSHAYGFATGYARTDWLNMATNGVCDLGSLAVHVFFFYSGLLVTMSIMNNGDAKRYWKRRIVRIFPSFVVVTLGIVFLVGPFITTLPVKEYFSRMDTYAYLKNLMFLNEHDLPGVFVGNVYGRSVNGPIWTIRVEVFCYLMCFVFCKLRLLDKKKIPLTIFAYIIVAAIMGACVMYGIEGVAAIIMPVTMFFVGMIYAVYAGDINLNKVIVTVAIVLMAILAIYGWFHFASIVFLPYILSYIAFGTRKVFKRLGKIGRSSYEIYLWGGFVGQLVVYVCGGNMSEYYNMIVTIPITIILGLITNYVVESITK